MERFTQLFCQLDDSPQMADKVAALASYFREAPSADAVWALRFLSRTWVKRLVPTRLLRQWVAEECRLPLWLVEEGYRTVGDLAETLALLLPPNSSPTPWSLSPWVEQRLLPLARAEARRQQELCRLSWQELETRQRLVGLKLMTGTFWVAMPHAPLVAALQDITHAPLAPKVVQGELFPCWPSGAPRTG